MAHTGHEPKLPANLLCYTSHIGKHCTASHTGWRLKQPCAWPVHSSHHAHHVLWSVNNNNNNNCVLTHTTSQWVSGLNEFTSRQHFHLFALLLRDGVRCNMKSVLHATLQMSNHCISINCGRLPRRLRGSRANYSFILLCSIYKILDPVACRLLCRPASSGSETSYSPCQQQLNDKGGLEDEYGCCYFTYLHWQYPLWSSSSTVICNPLCLPVCLTLSSMSSKRAFVCQFQLLPIHRHTGSIEMQQILCCPSCQPAHIDCTFIGLNRQIQSLLIT